jgi:hypothetical protein
LAATAGPSAMPAAVMAVAMSHNGAPGATASAAKTAAEQMSPMMLTRRRLVRSSSGPTSHRSSAYGVACKAMTMPASVAVPPPDKIIHGTASISSRAAEMAQACAARTPARGRPRSVSTVLPGVRWCRGVSSRRPGGLGAIAAA